MPSAASLFRLIIAFALTAGLVTAQEDTDAASSPVAESDLTDWDRLIYVPFKDLQKVFDNQSASAVIPYAEYMNLMKAYLTRPNSQSTSPDAVITQSSFSATVEKDVVRLTADLNITVLKKAGWARLPVDFGSVAVGKVTTDDEKSVILQGMADGRFELLLNGAGNHEVSLQLLTNVQTSPEHRSFKIHCPPVGISDLTLIIPEADQSVEISPLQVLLPSEAANDTQTTVKASLGATDHFEVRWNPEAGAKPIMDLLTSATNQTSIHIEQGLLQTKAVLNYEVLRGELTEVDIDLPAQARIIDVVSPSARIKNWTAKAIGDSHQALHVELLNAVTDQFQIEVQTEETPEAEILQLIGKSDNGSLRGIHANGVVRESGRITVTTDPSLTAVVSVQTGVKRVAVGSSKNVEPAGAGLAWEFSGKTGVLSLQIKPVEPRLLATQASRIVFDDDELRLTSRLTYTVERAGVFQLILSYPELLTIDTVRADGMSEFSVDKASGQLTLSLTQKRMGQVNVDITAHQSFDAAAAGNETVIPTITPQNVERESGTISIYAPRFLDVITVDEKVSGVFPADDSDTASIGRAARVSSWKYTQRPLSLAVTTSPRPAQLAATVATTATVEPNVVKVSSVVTFEVNNAGIDTFRLSVPESVADDVRFRSLSPEHVIQQRNKAEPVDGSTTWTLILQNETTGRVQLAADWETPLADADAEKSPQSITLEPVTVLPPFDEEQLGKRRVSLTQTRGEIRLLRHQSLSIAASGTGDTMEKVDVRELQLLPQDGYLAFRYFAQPVSIAIDVRKHEIHEVVATVVSRAAVEIVTDKQRLAGYRCRFRITTSERQRLQVNLPAGADLQAPLIDDRRTTFEPAVDVESTEGWDAYFVNVSREGTSDQEFLLTFQFRCPISEDGEFPYEGRGRTQILRLPLIGDDSGDTVVQETQLAVWGPKDISFVGEPAQWSIIGSYIWSYWNPLVSPSSAQEAERLNDWIGGSSSGSEFARQGHVSVYRALGRQAQIHVVWWNRPFLVAVICGALLFIGFILRRTSWENRITLTIIGCLAMALWSLKDSSESLQFLSAGSLGLTAVAAIWITGLFLGQHSPPSARSAAGPSSPTSPPDTLPLAAAKETTETDSGNNPPVARPPARVMADGLPAGTISPSPSVKQWMDDLMGGRS